MENGHGVHLQGGVLERTGRATSTQYEDLQRGGWGDGD